MREPSDRGRARGVEPSSVDDPTRGWYLGTCLLWGLGGVATCLTMFWLIPLGLSSVFMMAFSEPTGSRPASGYDVHSSSGFVPGGAPWEPGAPVGVKTSTYSGQGWVHFVYVRLQLMDGRPQGLPAVDLELGLLDLGLWKDFIVVAARGLSEGRAELVGLAVAEDELELLSFEIRAGEIDAWSVLDRTDAQLGRLIDHAITGSGPVLTVCTVQKEHTKDAGLREWAAELELVSDWNGGYSFGGPARRVDLGEARRPVGFLQVLGEGSGASGAEGPLELLPSAGVELRWLGQGLQPWGTASAGGAVVRCALVTDSRVYEYGEERAPVEIGMASGEPVLRLERPRGWSRRTWWPEACRVAGEWTPMHCVAINGRGLLGVGPDFVRRGDALELAGFGWGDEPRSGPVSRRLALGPSE